MITATLARYVEAARTLRLPDDVAEKARHHLLDTLAAIVSGGVMAPGQAGARLATRHPGGDEATVIATGRRADVTRAALANAMAAHADETDDSHEPSLTHPGCAVVPAALAVGEARDRTLDELLAGIVLGYDVTTRITRALWSDNSTLRTQGHSTHAIGGLFGAASAAGCLLGLGERELRYLYAYATQEAAGSRTWRRDVDHIEKAYAFAGMPASAGVWTSVLVSEGWTGVEEVFDGVPSTFDIFGIDPAPEVLIDGLGERFEIIATNIKRFSVGSPIQAPLDGLLRILEGQALDPKDVRAAVVRMPASLVRVVDDPEMPNINLQYLVTVALEDGDVSFAAAHDADRFARWKGGAERPELTVIKDDQMAPTRQAHVTIRTADGSEHSEHVTAVRGTRDNPMTRDEVEHKALDLIAPVLGEERARHVLDACRPGGAAVSCRELVRLLH